MELVEENYNSLSEEDDLDEEEQNQRSWARDIRIELIRKKHVLEMGHFRLRATRRSPERNGDQNDVD